MAKEENSTFKIMDRIFTLPLVNDSYNRMTNMTAPIQPYVKGSFDYVDSIACSGFDKVIDTMPYLQKYGMSDIYQMGTEALKMMPGRETDYPNLAKEYITNTEVGKQMMATVQRYRERLVKVKEEKEKETKEKEEKGTVPRASEPSAPATTQAGSLPGHSPANKPSFGDVAMTMTASKPNPTSANGTTSKPNPTFANLTANNPNPTFASMTASKGAPTTVTITASKPASQPGQLPASRGEPARKPAGLANM